MRPRTTPILVGALALGISCAPPAEPPAAQAPTTGAVQLIDSPSASGSGEPRLTAGADGSLYLSWIEPAEDNAHALRFSVWQGEAWSAARTISSGTDWFVNWADFPSLAALEDGTLAAHWLAKSGPDTYAYDVWLAVSTDGGSSWSNPVRAHSDDTRTEHGFASLVPRPEGDFAVVWLDGREMAGTPRGSMTLRHAILDRGGRVGPETLIDDRVCECCPTDALLTKDGELIVLYRDRSQDEIRDIYAARQRDGAWSKAAVHTDDWKVSGCPVNGPALSAAGTTLAAAWFNGAEHPGAVQVAFSPDNGRTFEEPIRIDRGNPLGRVDLVVLEDGSALVSWIERNGDRGEILVRRVRRSGESEPARLASDTSVSRSSGFPRMIRHADEIFLAWTETGDPSRVRTGRLPLSPTAP